MPKEIYQPSIWSGPDTGEAASTEQEGSNDILFFEGLLRDQGFQLVAGTDEVGRGCLAGPVVAAAVILPSGCVISGLDDSKKLSPEQRESLIPEIECQALSFSIAEVSPAEIDRINILQASLAAMKIALEGLNPGPDAVLVDGNQAVPISIPQKTVIKGDSRSVSIAAASVLAKVHRDRLMAELDSRFPGYGFAKHKGYATRQHFESLKKLGPCPVHRRSFKGVKELVQD